MKPKLIPEAKSWWRMFSVQAMGVNTALLATWAALPDDMKATIPQSWVFGAAIVISVLGILGRLVDQPKVRE